MVLIRGDAGLGKTRLAEKMLIWAEAQRIPNARSRSYAAEGSLNYGPVVEWLGVPALRQDWERLDAIWLSELTRLFSELPAKDAKPGLLREAWQRHRFFEAMSRAVVAGNGRLLLIDDLQWCDTETTEWLHFLLRFKTTTTLLVVATLRDTDLDPAHGVGTLIAELRISDQLADISLTPLDVEHTAELASLVAECSLSRTEALAVYEQTQGWPLLVVETIRAAATIAAGQPVSPTSKAVAGETPRLPPRRHGCRRRSIRLSRGDSRVCHREHANS